MAIDDALDLRRRRRHLNRKHRQVDRRITRSDKNRTAVVDDHVAGDSTAAALADAEGLAGGKAAGQRKSARATATGDTDVIADKLPKSLSAKFLQYVV